MAKKIKKYLQEIRDLLSKENKENIDWEYESQKHLKQIGFFMHERLIHLIVTVTFAIATIFAIIMLSYKLSFVILLLSVMFLVLLIPYVMHYYLLENSVQQMYDQYDEMIKLQEIKIGYERYESKTQDEEVEK